MLNFNTEKPELNIDPARIDASMVHEMVISYFATNANTSLDKINLGAESQELINASNTNNHWVSSARVYLEAQNHHISFDSERGSLTSFEFSRPSRVITHLSLCQKTSVRYSDMDRESHRTIHSER